MKIRTVILCVAMALSLSACTRSQRVRLVDGRVLQTKAVFTSDDRVQFKSEGWEYNLPSYLVSEREPADSITIQRVEITKDSINTPTVKLSTFEELAQLLDKAATRSHPVLLVLPDAVSWTESRRQEFGKILGEMSKRPDVGIEGLWPEKWLPGAPGRERTE